MKGLFVLGLVSLSIFTTQFQYAEAKSAGTIAQPIRDRDDVREVLENRWKNIHSRVTVAVDTVAKGIHSENPEDQDLYTMAVALKPSLPDPVAGEEAVDMIEKAGALAHAALGAVTSSNDKPDPTIYPIVTLIIHMGLTHLTLEKSQIYKDGPFVTLAMNVVQAQQDFMMLYQQNIMSLADAFEGVSQGGAEAYLTETLTTMGVSAERIQDYITALKENDIYKRLKKEADQKP